MTTTLKQAIAAVAAHMKKGMSYTVDLVVYPEKYKEERLTLSTAELGGLIAAAERCEQLEKKPSAELGEASQQEIQNFMAKLSWNLNNEIRIKKRDLNKLACWASVGLASKECGWQIAHEQVKKLEAQRAELRQFVDGKLLHCGSYAKQFLTEFLDKLNEQDASEDKKGSI